MEISKKEQNSEVVIVNEILNDNWWKELSLNKVMKKTISVVATKFLPVWIKSQDVDVPNSVLVFLVF